MIVSGTIVPISPAPGETCAITGAGRLITSWSTEPPSGDVKTIACVPMPASAATASESTRLVPSSAGVTAIGVTPLPETVTFARPSEARFSPLTTRSSWKPCVPMAAGATPVTIGPPAGLTVKLTETMPPAVFSAIIRSPGTAAASIVS